MPEMDKNIFYKEIQRFKDSPHHVFVFIVITTKNATFSCNENGVFREDVFMNIQEFLNLIWRQYQMFHVIAEFPFVCPGFFIIFQGKKDTGKLLYDRTIGTTPSNPTTDVLKKLLESRRNLPKGYPIRANVFERFPTSIYNCSMIKNFIKIEQEYLLNGLCGMDVLVMHDILRYFQFNVTFPEIDIRPGDYGYYNPTTGQLTGSLGFLLSGAFDISFNSRFMVRYVDTDDVQFINYISSDAICAVMSRPSQVPLSHYAFNVFRPFLWFTLIGTFVLIGVTVKLLDAIRRKAMKVRTETHPLYSYVLLSFCGCSFTQKRVSVSILGGTCLITSVTMLALYQSNVNYMYTSLLKYEQIKSLSELDERNIHIYTSPSILTMLGAHDPSRFSFDAIDKRTLISTSNIAIIQRQADMLLQIILDYLDDDGRPLLYIVNECYSNFFLSYVTRKDFPFISEMKVYIMHLIEAGLPDAYYRATKDALGLGVPVNKIVKGKTDPRPFYSSSIDEHMVPFGVLFTGYVVSTAVLVVEKWWARRMKQQSISSGT